MIDRYGNAIDPANIISIAHSHPGNGMFVGELSGGDVARMNWFLDNFHQQGSASYDQFSSYIYSPAEGKAYEYKANSSYGYKGVQLDLDLKLLPLW
jgi:hypothetical protein